LTPHAGSGNGDEEQPKGKDAMTKDQLIDRLYEQYSKVMSESTATVAAAPKAKPRLRRFMERTHRLVSREEWFGRLSQLSDVQLEELKETFLRPLQESEVATAIDIVLGKSSAVSNGMGH